MTNMIRKCESNSIRNSFENAYTPVSTFNKGGKRPIHAKLQFVKNLRIQIIKILFLCSVIVYLI